MARHRRYTGLTLSRARHRAPTRLERALETGLASAVASLVAVVLVTAMLGSDPSFPARS